MKCRQRFFRTRLFNPIWTGVFSCQSWTRGLILAPPPGILTIVGYILKNFLSLNVSVAQNLTILETITVFPQIVSSLE